MPRTLSMDNLKNIINTIYVKALYSFAKRKENELSFNKGDILLVIDRNYNGWWKGYAHGQVGRFPSNYCTDCNIEPTSFAIDGPKAIALYSYKARKPAELSFSKGDIISVIEQHKSGWWKACPYFYVI